MDPIVKQRHNSVAEAFQHLVAFHLGSIKPTEYVTYKRFLVDRCVYDLYTAFTLTGSPTPTRYAVVQIDQQNDYVMVQGFTPEELGPFLDNLQMRLGSSKGFEKGFYHVLASCYRETCDIGNITDIVDLAATVAKFLEEGYFPRGGPDSERVLRRVVLARNAHVVKIPLPDFPLHISRLWGYLRLDTHAPDTLKSPRSQHE